MSVLGANIRCDCNFNIYQLAFKNLNFVYFHFIFIQTFNYNFSPVISSMNESKIKWLVIEHLVYQSPPSHSIHFFFMGMEVMCTILKGTLTTF
jgi:hypothetical protein